MAVTLDAAAQRKAYWPVPIARAVPAAGLALWITFSADHSAGFGLIAFGVYGIVSGVVLGIVSAQRLGHAGVRPFFLAQAAIALVAGVLALMLHSAGVTPLLVIATIYAALSGFLELYSGIRTRRRFVASNDWLTTGAITVLAALAILVVPPGYSQHFTGPDGVKRVLDAAVVTVGLIGAYAAILTVFLLIAGFSAKWGTQPEKPDAATIEPSTAESETTA